MVDDLMSRGIIPPDLPVEYEGPDEAWADPVRVRQILRNLSLNAEQHGSGLARISVAGGSQLEVRIVDRGDGLAPSLGEQAFDIFITTKQATGDVPATGIGLWLSRGLAERMGGSLTYEQADGGAQFLLTLPRPPRGR
ncbi:MAG: ATP-binding protein [Acidimicrobiia bacterium]|nr:ATP-binding protein [Acidimicrobiia bacterium]